MNYKSFTIFGKLIAWQISKEWDVGLFSIKSISSPTNSKAKALRIVIWRLALWVQYK